MSLKVTSVSKGFSYSYRSLTMYVDLLSKFMKLGFCFRLCHWIRLRLSSSRSNNSSVRFEYSSWGMLEFVPLGIITKHVSGVTVWTSLFFAAMDTFSVPVFIGKSNSLSSMGDLAMHDPVGLGTYSVDGSLFCTAWPLSIWLAGRNNHSNKSSSCRMSNMRCPLGVRCNLRTTRLGLPVALLPWAVKDISSVVKFMVASSALNALIDVRIGTSCASILKALKVPRGVSMSTWL